MRRGWNRDEGRRGGSKREETPPKALLYLSYNYHNRASNHPSPPPYSPPRPPSTDHLPPAPPSTAATANWKLANTFSLRCSLFSAWNCLLRDVDRSESMLTNNHWNRGINVGQARNFVHFTDSWWFKIISLFQIRSIPFYSNVTSSPFSIFLYNYINDLYLSYA